MRSFELTVFINCPKETVYDHLSQPLNMIGLQPLLTEIDVLKERRDTDGIVLRPFYTVETFRLLGLPVYRNRIYSVIHLTKPKDELKFHVYSKPRIEIVFTYRFEQFDDVGTKITQTVEFVKLNRLLEKFVVEQAKQAQRALLSNLKIRLEKQ
ncbi:MAG: SRPBCC family protein [Chloroflexi bacterium]|nr:SRPBCC family protein [Chloroflexota bacterium]